MDLADKENHEALILKRHAHASLIFAIYDLCIIVSSIVLALTIPVHLEVFRSLWWAHFFYTLHIAIQLFGLLLAFYAHFAEYLEPTVRGDQLHVEQLVGSRIWLPLFMICAILYVLLAFVFANIPTYDHNFEPFLLMGNTIITAWAHFGIFAMIDSFHHYSS